MVFAAASLKNALDAINVERQKSTGKNAVISYAASSTLAKQIENAAPADIFISADLKWMDYLDDKQLIDHASRVNLLGNALVLIAPADSKATATIAPNFPLAAVARRRQAGDGRPGLGPGRHLWQGGARQSSACGRACRRHVAAAENVRAALLLVSRGEAPLGIVYKTDAAVDPGVKIVATFPADSVRRSSIRWP